MKKIYTNIFLDYSFIFFCLLLFFLPIGTSWHFAGAWSYLGGGLNDFTTYFVYFIDILVFLTLGSWLVGLLWQFWRTEELGDWRLTPWQGFSVLMLSGVVYWGLVSHNWAVFPEIMWYRWLRLLAVFLLFCYVVLTVRFDWKKWRLAIYFLAAGAVIQVIWGVTQYIRQDNFGLWWLGEVLVSPQALGVAKILVDGEKVIRAYGSLAHANIFGFYLLAVLSFVLFAWQRVLVNVKQRKWEKWFWPVLIGLLLTGILLSFSRSVWLATFLVSIGWLVNVWPVKKNISPLVVVLVGVGLLTVFIFNQKAILARSQPDLATDVSLQVRADLDSTANEMISRSYYKGYGLGNYVPMLSYFTSGLEAWQYQPVHNTFKLVWVDLGVIGFIIYCLWWLGLLAVLLVQPKQINWLAIMVFLAMLWLQFFDHYTWDNWTAQLLLILVVSFLTLSPNIIEEVGSRN